MGAFKYECSVCGEIFIRRKAVNVIPGCSRWEARKLFAETHPETIKKAKKRQKTRKVA